MGSPARLDTRGHVASAGPRQCASPASAFIRSEAPWVAQAAPLSAPSLVLWVSNSENALQVVAEALVWPALCCRASCLKIRAKGSQPPIGVGAEGPPADLFGRLGPVWWNSRPTLQAASIRSVFGPGLVAFLVYFDLSL